MEKELQKQREWANAEALDRRDQQWQELLHQQRVDRLEGEVELTRAERRIRVEQLQAEAQDNRRREDLEFERRRKEFEMEMQAKDDQSQMDKMLAMQRMNAESMQQQTELREKRRRLDSELENLKEDKAAERERQRLETLKTLGPEALIATADVEQARLIAETQKATGEAVVQQKVAETMAMQTHTSKVEQQQLYERMLDAQKAATDQLAQAYREGIQGQQNVAGQGFGAMGQMAPQNVVVPGMQTPVPGVPQQPVAPGQAAVVVCSSCRADNLKTAKFCSNCGNQL